ncbi:MAG TPA: NfeD family protein, partial [Vicinamibacterales bacterium]|nr:NfeD family protein [Vicinamibacterales bacterium]
SIFDNAAVAWITIAILAAIVEISIPHFGVIFVSLAAIGSLIAAMIGFDVPVQIGAFVIVLALSWTMLRPRVIARIGVAPGVPSRTEALIGAHGVVTESIDPVVGAGRVNVSGQDWAARSSAPLQPGTRIRVTGADGIVLEVIPA